MPCVCVCTRYYNTTAVAVEPCVDDRATRVGVVQRVGDDGRREKKISKKLTREYIIIIVVLFIRKREAAVAAVGRSCFGRYI